jgi:hypothetical protein
MDKFLEYVEEIAESFHGAVWDNRTDCRDPFEKTTCPYWTDEGCAVQAIQCPAVYAHLERLYDLLGVALREQSFDIESPRGDRREDDNQDR